MAKFKVGDTVYVTMGIPQDPLPAKVLEFDSKYEEDWRLEVVTLNGHNKMIIYRKEEFIYTLEEAVAWRLTHDRS